MPAAAIGSVWETGSWEDTSWEDGSWAVAVVAAVAADGKYAPEHASALVDVGAVQGFASEHASALKDVGEAGSG